MYTKESIEGLRGISDPREVLMHVGSISAAEMTDNNYEVRCCCPLHGGDNDTGFSWRLQEGMWTCFTQGCGEGSGRDVFAFVQLKLGIDFKEAVEYLADMFGYSLEKGQSEGTSNYLKSSRIRQDYQSMERAVQQGQQVLWDLPGYYEGGQSYVDSYLASRGYTDSSLIRKFNLYPCWDAFEYLRLGIPAYDADNQLVGVNARKMDGVLSYPESITLQSGKLRKFSKYEMISNFKKGLCLFNLNNAKENSLERGLILVEGELSCIRMVSYGFTNTVAARGSVITKDQAMLLYKHCFHITLLVESGQAAVEGTLKTLEKIPGLKVSIAKLDEGDPDDNSKEVVVQALENSRLYSESEVQYCIENGKLLD